MITQKDIHNLIVENSTPQQKAYIALQCGNNPERIKAAEECAAKALNIAIKAFSNPAMDYLNKKI